MQLLCRNDDLTYFLGEKKNVVYGSCKRLWFWVDGRYFRGGLDPDLFPLSRSGLILSPDLGPADAQNKSGSTRFFRNKSGCTP